MHAACAQFSSMKERNAPGTLNRQSLPFEGSICLYFQLAYYECAGQTTIGVWLVPCPICPTEASTLRFFVNGPRRTWKDKNCSCGWWMLPKDVMHKNKCGEVFWGTTILSSLLLLIHGWSSWGWDLNTLEASQEEIHGATVETHNPSEWKALWKTRLWICCTAFAFKEF